APEIPRRLHLRTQRMTHRDLPLPQKTLRALHPTLVFFVLKENAPNFVGSRPRCGALCNNKLTHAQVCPKSRRADSTPATTAPSASAPPTPPAAADTAPAPAPSPRPTRAAVPRENAESLPPASPE